MNDKMLVMVSPAPNLDVETLLERVWNHMGGTVSRPAIRQVLAEVILDYESAPIQTFVPIFVHKETVKRLRALEAASWRGSKQARQ